MMMLKIRSRRRVRAAWWIWLFEVSLAVAGTLLLFLSRLSVRTIELLGPLNGLLFVLGYATVGALILSRRPGHRVGQLFSGLALPMAIGTFALGYTVFAFYANPRPLPAEKAMAWLQTWMRYLSAPAPLALPALYFPDGRLPSPRWRWLVWVVIASTAAVTILAATEPGQIGVYLTSEFFPLRIPNPVGIVGFDRGREILGFLGWPMALLAGLATLAAQLFRYLRARSEERQQLKWLAYCAAIILAIIALEIALLGLRPWAGNLVFISTIVGVPTAVGIAILRYRLYDIDLIVRRTLVYGAVTATLTLLYFGSVVSLQALFRTLTGQGDQLAIVASTLGIAALFTPVRRRIQNGIDRRFYRSKYDAEKVLAAFGATVREEVDLERLTDRLLRAVQETMQPAHVSLWLKGPNAKAQGRQDALG